VVEWEALVVLAVLEDSAVWEEWVVLVPLEDNQAAFKCLVQLHLQLLPQLINQLELLERLEQQGLLEEVEQAVHKHNLIPSQDLVVLEDSLVWE
jgi:hypothetical protein